MVGGQAGEGERERNKGKIQRKGQRDPDGKRRGESKESKKREKEEKVRGEARGT